MEAPETLQQAMAFFSDPQRAFEAAKEFRWPDGNPTCPRCGGSKHSFIKVVPNVGRETLQNAILANVTPFAKVYTDEHFGYHPF